ncbi:nicotinate phosphoribosyltransferase [Macrolepiota fuliginosa MF-IS2]|uniref:Nicotinate phosphoribosyltransferase n=1 Tax=Macrolepiota fuliginosa MF-IS2 TaxID=1400762 RepID=A0A9P5XFN2_9AGAR|nr:nicotinate phosphoribosyltransferase [Macrolepiota fuliginosa MF-IS2]
MAAVLENPALPRSILDTDLYKLTMQQAVLRHFPDVQATYRFTNRNKNITFSRQFVDKYRASVSLFTDIILTPDERAWLESKCPYFTKDYLDYLSSFRFKPEQVHINFVPTSEDGLAGQVEISTSGSWVETILWEVPLLAILSETYFLVDDTDWTYDGQEELAYTKGKTLYDAGCWLSEFGTRRRRSSQAQDIVMQGLIRASKDNTNPQGRLSGTSNVHLAHKYDLAPIGTIAHEWFMGIGALQGYEHVNDISLQLWEEAYPNTPALLIALTDTFSTDAFFNEISKNPARAIKWTGLRQDSGDPLLFAPKVKETYDKIGIEGRDKLVIYSDSLNVDKALKIKRQCDELGFKKVSFGIGTFLTNDFRTVSSGLKETSKAHNIVIKLATLNGQPCVKISDDLDKNTGDKDTVAHVKRVFNL